jgi:microcystin-dependent protein
MSNLQGPTTIDAPTTVRGALTVESSIAAKGLITGPGMTPLGTVIMYYGNISDATHFGADGKGLNGTPFENWQLCNGNNGSPDLRGMFVVGAGGAYKTGDKGGVERVKLIIKEMPRHSHWGQTEAAEPRLNYSGVAFNSMGTSYGIMVNRGVNDPNGYRPNMLTTVGWSEITVNPHQHKIPLDGGDESHENRPPYFALAYLYKLK